MNAVTRTQGSPLGLHRVLAPAGVLPQAADRLDPDSPLREDELRIDVEYLNLDAASYRQLHEEHGGDGDAIRAAVCRIVRERGKMHNPVTGSGGMLIGTVAEAGPRTPLGLVPGDRVASLVSLTLTPLTLTDGLRDWDGLGERVPARGHAVLFGRSVAAALPADLPDELSLAVLDVCGAPALTARTVAEHAARSGAAPSVAVLGAAGKSGSLALAAARRAGAGRLVGVVPDDAEAAALAASGLAGTVLRADARDAVGLSERLAGSGGPVDITVVCTDVPGCEHAAVLATRDGGTVVFFSMATSFPTAALGAEGLRADVTMLIGNGYQPGHAEQALDLLRTEPGVRALFAHRLTPPRTATASSGPASAPAGAAVSRPTAVRPGGVTSRPSALLSRTAGSRPAAAPVATVPAGPSAAPVGKLGLDPDLVRRARELAVRAGRPVVDMARSHTTVAVERAALRLAGLSGADAEGIPWVNRLVDAVRDQVGLEHGVALPVWHALRTGTSRDLTELAARATARDVSFRLPEGAAAQSAVRDARRAMAEGLSVIDGRRRERERLIRRWGEPRGPLVYLIVATGDIHEDVRQAVAAARGGADVIAVIRSTGQSLLDYVPHGATREGYAGTYATQENFRLMRAALDDVSAQLGRYVRLTNYASGLCMPEIAVLAGLERLDMMLNDSMYGILFRDINPVRTFVDQRFSRQLHARAGIVINTGEDNYLTTADAMQAAHTVTASQLLNEYFGKEAGLADAQLGLGHAFEIDPDLPDSFRMELAHALLARELFPDAPLKWMPPTRHMTGDVFRGYLLNGFFNLAGALTRQDILLVGMMTEAVVTPFLSDRDLALQNVRYVMNAAGALEEDFRPAPGGVVARRADAVLGEAVGLLERLCDRGLLDAIAEGTFGGMRRPVDGGRGRDGVAERAPGYRNPAVELLEAPAAPEPEGGDRR
ncbi:threonine dehydrogenase-like Zn-dependent dehydrogenase [Streptomyces sp. 3330]|uniref:lysine 5,6-aminomutase subunit alpha n=1 Tax=Streptomyces sp. 3330 TaxID=2817755 RepID=UPI00285D6BE8|nr:lysine 5,6-aminomutase subunit alpha [Streptomyces sp. 3330]MDR6979086.1 threonine dehydrogenase-like Zn-dependent dehydrogenase [Streptomyces sp. 3330]